MAKANLNDIYSRVSGIAQYHPYTADTAADWSLEAGDTVTVSRDGTRYTSPVHAATIKWNGKQSVTLESNGSRERGPVAKMSARSYNYGNGGGNSYRGGARKNTEDQKKFTELFKNDDEIGLRATNLENENEERKAEIKVTADNINAEVSKRKKGDAELKASIKIEADRISQVVESVGADGKVTAASIVAAVNKSGSSVAISADHIMLSGTTTLNNIMSVTSGAVHINKPLFADGSYADFNEIRIHGSKFTVNEAVGDYMIKSASVSGNVLTLTKFNGEKVTFSKATTLSGAWSGGKYTVTAKQGTKAVETDWTQLMTGEVSGSTQWAGNTAFISLKASTKGASGMQDTGRVISLNCQAIYDAGARSVGHNPTATITEVTSSTSHIHGSSLGSYSAASVKGRWILIDAKCGGKTNSYYIYIS